MNDLLTSRQVQEILKVDRITVYRMLQDGRLKGVKIGQQWRFPAEEVERALGVRLPAESGKAAGPETGFPTHCVQTIQDLLAEVGQVSAVVLDLRGQPLTRLSRPTRLHQLLVSTAAGRQAVQSAWEGFARGSLQGEVFFSDPAEMRYVGAPILDQGRQIAVLLAGQWRYQPQDPREAPGRLRRLADVFQLPDEELRLADSLVPVIEPQRREQVEAWPSTAARAVMSILHERLGFMDRLQQIANLTQLS